MKKTISLLVLGLAVLVGPFSGLPLAQEKPDNSKIVGTWKVEIFAGETTYILSLVVIADQDQLAGKVSESMGMFADVAISDIFYDGVSFRFSFVSPTPPDGISRKVNLDFKVAEDSMAGLVSVPDLGVTADARATRERR